ncbi:MAG: hypothetical protein OIF47_00490 [Marinibacterium sp.]|nr:hypothetical protein [Marinibacterium sp.]
MTLLQTSNGVIDLTRIPPEALCLDTLGHTLSQINRFAGRTPQPWSVAAHSVLVSRLCQSPHDKLWALLHDAHEAFIGDIITPAIEWISTNAPQPGCYDLIRDAVDNAKARIDTQIRTAWCIDTDRVDFELVAHYDHLAYLAESIMLMGADIPRDPRGEIERACGIIAEFQMHTAIAAQHGWSSEIESLQGLGLYRLPERAA